jgi:hypothetical protein
MGQFSAEKPVPTLSGNQQTGVQSHLTNALVASLVVGETSVLAVGQSMGVELAFGDIDAQWYPSASFPSLCLSFRARPRVSVQAEGKDQGDPTLARPVGRPDPTLAAVERAARLSPAVPRFSGVKSHMLEIAKRVGISRLCGAGGSASSRKALGLLREKTHPPGIPPVPQAMPWSSALCANCPVQSPIGTARAMAKGWVFRGERSRAHGPPISSSRSGSGS